MNDNIFELKDKKKIKLKNDFGLGRKKRALGLIKLENKDLIIDLRDGLLTLDIDFIVEIPLIETEKLGDNIIATGKINKVDLAGFDFAVFDECEININDYSKKGVTPIVKTDCHLSSVLIQFNPIKNSGNSFLYDQFNKWYIFASIVRYLENYKFPFDNKNLVKNIMEL